MTNLISLKEACDKYVQDGEVVAPKGFTLRLPYVADHKIIRQQKRGLTLVRITLEEVIANTGWAIRFAEPMSETLVPTEHALSVVREPYRRSAQAHEGEVA